MSAVVMDPVALIGTVGFPIAMCLLVYLDLRSKVQCMCDTLVKLEAKIAS